MFKEIIDRLYNFLSDFSKKLFSRSTRILLDSVMDIGLEIVKELAKDDVLANEDKRAIAYDRIKQKAYDEGIEVSGDIINSAIKLLVARLKG